jgi:hypothetical protein
MSKVNGRKQINRKGVGRDETKTGRDKDSDPEVSMTSLDLKISSAHT